MTRRPVTVADTPRPGAAAKAVLASNGRFRSLAGLHNGGGEGMFTVEFRGRCRGQPLVVVVTLQREYVVEPRSAPVSVGLVEREACRGAEKLHDDCGFYEYAVPGRRSRAAASSGGIVASTTAQGDATIMNVIALSSAAVVGGGMLFALNDRRGLLAHRETEGSLHVYTAVQISEDWLDGIDFGDAETAKRRC